MRRRLTAILSLVSLLGCVAVLAAWPWSYRHTQFVGWSDPGQFAGALSMGGLVRLEHATYAGEDPGWSYTTYPTPAGTPPGLWGEVATRDRVGGPLRSLGFGYARIDYNYDGQKLRRALYVPHWAIAALLGVMPGLWLLGAYRARLPRAGHCPRCGYDLRATPGRCPECGAGAAAGDVVC
jgi:hypothetical protein